MDGQPLNPAPEPAPEPQPTPEPTTAEPPADDNFAEPTHDTNAAWQPTQATAPQLGGMDVPPPAMVQPTPEPKKNNTGVIIGIIAGALVVVGAIIAVVLLANNSGSGNKSSEAIISEQAKARNKQREADLERFLRAVKDYKTNNKGKTPFGTSYDAEKIATFTMRYIDENVDKSGVQEGKSLVCTSRYSSSYASCPQFTDIQGKVFGWTVNVAESGKKNAKISQSNSDGVDAILHVYVKATCGSEEGTYNSADSEDTFAIYYFLEGGKILCGDSENGLANKEKEEKDTDNSEKGIMKRDNQREDDVARILTAVNDYQTNNSGATPFGKAYDKTKLGLFVYRYIENKIDNSGAASGQSFKCKQSECDEFSDPDGTVYGFTVDVAKSGSQDEKIKYSTDKMDHIMHVYVNAGCGSKDGTYDSGTGERQIAIFYIGENEIICYDNH